MRRVNSFIVVFYTVLFIGLCTVPAFYIVNKIKKFNSSIDTLRTKVYDRDIGNTN
jgi:hypothetical protein